MTESITLGELARLGRIILNDGYRTRSDELGEPGVPILRVGEVQDGYITPTFGDHVRSEFRPKFGPKTSAANDVVVTTKGTVGRVALMRRGYPEFVYSPQVCFFRCDPGGGVDPEWLYYWFKSPEFVSQALGVQSQTDMAPYINLADMRAIAITVPALSEQMAIAGVLGALDDKIESNRRLVQVLRQTAQVVVASAVVNAKLVPLQSVAVIQRGFGYKSSGFVDVGIPMISMGSSGVRGWLNRKKIRQYEPTVKDKYKVRTGQVLVVNVDLTWKLDVLGWPLVVPPELDGAVISNDVFGLDSDASRPWLSWIIWAELQTPRARAVIEGGAKGTTVASIGVDTLSSVQIPVPDDATGAAVGTEVSELVNRAWQAEREVDSLTQTRDALLPHLLSGRLRVRDAEKVVEEVV